MSYLYVGVGGSGAKLMHTLVHLTAAGLLAEGGRELKGFLVDSDQSNGNVTACSQAGKLYKRCRELKFGSRTPLFGNQIELSDPWTPVTDGDVASLSTVFDLTQMRRVKPEDADLMEILFSPDERDMTIFEGFRGRPAIGATMFGRTVNLKTQVWKELSDNALNARSHRDVSLLLAGSVFGGSGAAGVPTICRLLEQGLTEKIPNLRLGLVLFLPYFTYDKVEGEHLQADPHTFATATAEALKYYDERHFLKICDAIYAVGERHPAKMPIPAVGKKDQRNPPHFVELVAGLGAIQFMGGTGKNESVVFLAGRENENTVQWADLPTADGRHDMQMALLQQFILFAVAYHYIVYPEVVANLHEQHAVIDHLRDAEDVAQAGKDLEAVDTYLQSFLNWLLSISTPERVGVEKFIPGLVDVNVIAEEVMVEEQIGDRLLKRKAWQLKASKLGKSRDSTSVFNEKGISTLFRNLDEHRKPNVRAIFRATTERVTDQEARGAGKLVRAVYDACKLS